MGNKKEKSGKVFSLAFVLAIPSYFFLGAICFIALLILLDKYLFIDESWAAFSFGFVASAAIIGTSEFQWLRTFVHEVKHGIAILLRGGSLKKFRVGSKGGSVEFELAKDQLLHQPRIGLAPYCFPLFSLPVLIAAIIFEEHFRLPFCFLLGGALGGDITFSYREIHPRQTDFQSIVGGFFLSGLYIAGVLFFWASACLLWVCAGRLGFVYAAYLAVRILHNELF